MILIVDMNYKKDSLGFYEFVNPIISIIKNKEKYEIKHYSEIYEKDLQKYKKIIVSGSPLKDNKFIECPRKFKWIKTIKIPVLGICAGMQAICVAFGLKIEKCSEIGMIKIKTTAKNPLFSSDFSAYALHNFAPKINTKDFKIIAESEKCIQAISNEKRQIYCVLFHPEARNKEIIENFLMI